MRRTDREVKEIEKIDEIIGKCKYCRVGLIDNGEVYIVPLNFGYKRENEKFVLYFHSAKEGRKISLIQNSTRVGFQMDCNTVLKDGKQMACSYSTKYESIIGTGEVEFVEDESEKNYALQTIMFQNTEKKNWEFKKEKLDSIKIFKLSVLNLSCKVHK